MAQLNIKDLRVSYDRIEAIKGIDIKMLMKKTNALPWLEVTAQEKALW